MSAPTGLALLKRRPRPTAVRCVAAAGALLICLALFLVGLMPGSAATAFAGERGQSGDTSAQSADPNLPEPEVTNLTPQALTSGSNLSINVAIPAGQEGFVPGVRTLVEVFLQPIPLDGAAEVDSFLAGEDFPGWRLNYQLTELETRPDGGTGLRVTLPPENLPLLDADTAGLRGITVRLHPGYVLHSPDNPEPTDVRSLLFLEPPHEDEDEDEAHRLPVSVLAASEGTSPLDAAGVQRLTRLAGVPGVSLGLSATDMPAGAESGALPTDSEPQSAEQPQSSQDAAAVPAAWAALLAQPTEIVAVPPANADLGLLAESGQPALMELAQAGRLTTAQLEAAAARRGGKPRAKLVTGVSSTDPTTLTAGALSGISSDTVLLTEPLSPATAAAQPADSAAEDPNTGGRGVGSGAANPATGQYEIGSYGPDADDPGYTSSEYGDSNAPQVHVTDDGNLLVDPWLEAAALLDTEPGTTGQELITQQRLRAASWQASKESADATQGTPFGPQGRLVTTSLPGDSGAMAGESLILRSRALLGNDWVEPVSFTGLLQSGSSTRSHVTLPEAQPSPATLAANSSALAPLTDISSRATALLAATDEADRDAVEADLWPTLHPYTAGLAPAQRAKRVPAAVSALEAASSSVRVLPMSTVNVVNRAAKFPATLVNQADYPLTVDVFISSSHPRLQSGEPVSVTLPAQGRSDVHIPINAVGSGDTDVHVVVSAGGAELTKSTAVPVRVRADWEDTGTIVVSVAVVALFGFGLLRTVRRNQAQAVAAAKQEHAGEN